jgi:hypothetical protein
VEDYEGSPAAAATVSDVMTAIRAAYQAEAEAARARRRPAPGMAETLPKIRAAVAAAVARPPRP